MPILASVPRERLNYAVENGAAHYRAIWTAVRDHACAFAIVPQSREVFDLSASEAPLILVIGDDMDSALGPDGFDLGSVEAAVSRCDFAVIVSSAAHVEPYQRAANYAVQHHRNVVLIETRLDREQQWIEFVETHAPMASMLISTVRPEGRA